MRRRSSAPTLVRWGNADNRALPAELIVHAWNAIAQHLGLVKTLQPEF